MQYTVVLEKAEHNWSAYIPDAPGCVSVGATRAEVEQNIQKALVLWLEASTEEGYAIPQPGTWTTVVDIEIPEGTRFARRDELAAPSAS
jgi:predicted RNase H-like HicB family nuclease